MAEQLVQSRREKLDGVPLKKTSNAGLILDRCLQYAVGKSTESIKAKKEVLEVACAVQQGAYEIYSKAFKRRQSHFKVSVKQKHSLVETLNVKSRIVVGLGNESPIETGVTLNHTYGVPMIPGSALKGLSAHYCDQVWGDHNQCFQQEYSKTRVDESGKEQIVTGPHQMLFGTNRTAGFITFHDSWIVAGCLGKNADPPNQGLVRDVMTPHHGNYNSQEVYKKGDKKGQSIPPTDFDDPNPIPFLSVIGTFHVALSCEDNSETGQEWLALAMAILKQALVGWGIGGKTSSGYGRMAK